MFSEITEKDVLEGKDKEMVLEKNRLKSYKVWPFSEGVCTKESMSCAGFYHCNAEGEDDGVRCFCCFKEMEGWDQNDDPWVEHRSHQNNCYFAKLGKPEAQLTVKEFIKVIEERELNLLNKKIESMKSKEKEMLQTLGLIKN